MSKDFLNDDFLEDLNVEELYKKPLGADNLAVEDFNVEKKRKAKNLKVEDFNGEEKTPANFGEQGITDWNQTIAEPEELMIAEVKPGIYKTVGKQEFEKLAEIKKPEKKKKEKKEKKDDEETEEKPSALKEVLSWSVTFLLAAVFAFVLKNYVIINATVPTGSMEHTIEPKDDLFGLRLAYINSEPQRGDIIIFRYPDDETKKFVKRVIGLPGESVRITDGKIYIDDSKEPLQEDYLKEEWIKGTGPFEYRVPEGAYFVLGDNRNDSLDSRYWENTYVTDDEIIGKAYFIYYPFSRFGSLYK